MRWKNDLRRRPLEPPSLLCRPTQMTLAMGRGLDTSVLDGACVACFVASQRCERLVRVDYRFATIAIPSDSRYRATRYRDLQCHTVIPNDPPEPFIHESYNGIEIMTVLHGHQQIPGTFVHLPHIGTVTLGEDETLIASCPPSQALPRE